MKVTQTLTLSLITHLALLFIFMLYINPLREAVKTDQTLNSALASYLSPLTPTVPHQKTKASRQLAETARHHAKTTIPQPKAHPNDDLITLLHTAIQNTQQYPESAAALQQEGRTTLAFTLFPDGTIQNAHIQQSSGTNSLDHAALAALHAAVPFQQINRYLTSAAEYQVDIVFKLG